MTRKLVILIWIISTFAGAIPNANAVSQLLPLPAESQVKVCEFAADDKLSSTQPEIPDFNDQSCRHSTFNTIDPQNTSLWVAITFDKPDNWSIIQPPYGVFMMAKAASRFYFNGVWLGSNGKPAADKSEIAGKMDTVFYLSEELVKDKDNQLVIYLSAQHSLISLNNPLHFLGIGHYVDPKEYLQEYSELSLMLLGAYAIGALYFLMLSRSHAHRRYFGLFGGLCVLAAIQLGAELSRGVISYDYPWHDIRLLTVTTCAFLFGVLILIYSSQKINGAKGVHWIYAGIIISLAAVFFAPGFDAKTTTAIFVPLIVGLVQMLIAWWRNKDKTLLTWFVVQLTITTIIVINAGGFHEFTYFLIIGVLLCYLFVRQVSEQWAQQVQFNQDQQHIAKLEYQLALKEQSQVPAKLEITGSGKTQWLSVADIGFCKAAGDYVELYLLNGSEQLYAGSLKHIETKLPSTFLRVHRSYMVNLNEISSLISSKESSYMLCLTNGQQVPVSRRLLPAVRATIKSSLS